MLAAGPDMAAPSAALRQRRAAAGGGAPGAPERVVAGPAGSGVGPQPPPLLPGTFWLTRIVLLRSIALLYWGFQKQPEPGKSLAKQLLSKRQVGDGKVGKDLMIPGVVAFLVAYHQNKQLIGEKGLLPCKLYLQNVKKYFKGKINLDALSYAPTIIWFLDWSDMDSILDCISLLGLATSAFVVITGCANMVLMAVLWVLYLSLVNVGQIWVTYRTCITAIFFLSDVGPAGWESQLLETGFLGMFLCPLWTLSRLPPHTPPPTIVIWAFRWLIFRIMLGAGLIKIRGDRCWRELTCMDYHYEISGLYYPEQQNRQTNGEIPTASKSASVQLYHLRRDHNPSSEFGRRSVWSENRRNKRIDVAGEGKPGTQVEGEEGLDGVVGTAEAWGTLRYHIMGDMVLALSFLTLSNTIIVVSHGPLAIDYPLLGTQVEKKRLDTNPGSSLPVPSRNGVLAEERDSKGNVKRFAAEVARNVITGETQPVPNPIAYFMHRSPWWFHRFETLVNHFIELLVPFFLLLGWRMSIVHGLLQILFQGKVKTGNPEGLQDQVHPPDASKQVLLIISGNLSFLNWLTMVPSIACFDDASLGFLFSSRRGAVKERVVQMQLQEAAGEQLPPRYGCYVRKVVNISLGLLIAYLSIPVVINLLSSRQVMNTSFNPLRIVNTYGAFGSITKERTEVVLQGTSSLDPNDPAAVWEEYDFKCKPGDLKRRPCFITPYHYRLDWLMWFAAFQTYEQNEWIIHLAGKLLAQEEETLSLMATNPFAGREPPRWIRGEHFKYKFSQPGGKHASEGRWWIRKRIGPYFPPVNLQGLKKFFEDRNWPYPTRD
ncbi:Lmf1 [Columba guinea]|nr:Lmf1 [Columba guinea]